MHQFIPVTAAKLLEHQLPHTDRDGDRNPVAMLRVPTPAMREQLIPRLISMGMVPVSQEQMRATTIDEIYRLWGDEAGEERAKLIDTIWVQEDAWQAEMQFWLTQERERKRDEVAGAPARDALPAPTLSLAVRDRYRARTYIQEAVERSDRLRALHAREADEGRTNDVLMIRLALAFVADLGVDLEQRNDILTDDAVHQLRERLEILYGRQGGDAAWRDLAKAIDGLYTLSEEEEGNSDSPAGNMRDQTSSRAPTGDGANTDGTSTSETDATPAAPSSSHTGRTRGAGSATTTARSSTSTSGRGGGRRKSSRTAAP